MVVSSRVGRLWQGVRRWRSGTDDQPPTVDPDLPESDLRRIRKLVDEVVEIRGGEVAARRRARLLGVTYATWSGIGERRFYSMLATEYGNDHQAVEEAIDHVLHATGPSNRRTAESELRRVLVPKREQLFRRFIDLEGGLAFLVQMREDVRDLIRSDATGDEGLVTLDGELRSILDRWFDVGLLTLIQITWSTPASFLEKLIEYEAVHAIGSWADLKARLGTGRRCYAFIHPAMPDDPLIFVEVALTEGMADAVGPLIKADDCEPRTDEDTRTGDDEERRFDTAIFYSISNCHQGLAGVSLGDFLIKSVVEELARELPTLRRYATLSPLPDFRRWLRDELAAGNQVLSDGEISGFEEKGFAPAIDHLTELVSGPMPAADDSRVEAAKSILLRLAADYVVNQRRPDGRAADSVAHFHLSNGARAERLNWMANPTEIGWERGLGMMVNYRYEIKSIEANHDRYIIDGVVSAADDVARLLAGSND